MKNKLVEEAPYHPGYEDAGFKPGDFRNVDIPKPTAWIREDGVIAFHPKTEVDSQGFKWFPLYTHPAKTLTDKELVDIYQELYDDFDKNPLMADGVCYRIFPIEIGRAILRKAQEK
jgi:hypothetical protein